MLYYLFDYLNQFDVPVAGVFQYISFRASMAMLVSLIITILFGGRLITYLRSLQIRETVRKLGLEGERQKQGTPTMGGIIIIMAILIPTLLLAKIHNIYIILLIVSTIWMGLIGFLDDYIKVFKQNKKGLRAQFKIIGQVGLGLIVGVVMFFHKDVVIRKDVTNNPNETFYRELNRFDVGEGINKRTMVDYKSIATDVPFLKAYQFDYAKVLSLFTNAYQNWGFLLYIPIVIFIVTAVSNAANLTDGIDGLATGVSAIAGICLGIFAYVSGNTIAANYLNVMYLPNTGELLVFSAAFVGACVGFLWYNAYPAQIFMGDTGSLTLGGIIATLALVVRKELLIPILCGIFLVENLSVVIQVSYFKYTKRKFGEGKRVFLMAPLHHHYQKKGMHESKIVTRFWIVAILLAVLSFITLKLR